MKGTRSAKITRFIHDDDYDLCLRIGELIELSEVRDCGPPVILSRFSEGAWFPQDIIETIRLGLIGGGLQLPSHTHAISDVTNLQTNLDAKLSTANAATLYQAVSAKAVANGYASLDASAKLPVAQLPSHTHVIADVTNLQASLDAKLSIANATVYQLTSAKGAANGYAPLDASSKVPTANMPTLTKSDVGLSNVDNTSDASKPVSTATQSALNLKLDVASKATSAEIRAGANDTKYVTVKGLFDASAP